MNKCLSIFAISFKEMIAYRFNVIGGVFFSFLRVVLALILWSAIYEQNGKNFAYSLKMMITYYILVTIFANIQQSGAMAGEFSAEIRDGKFSKYLVRPVNPLGYFVSKCLAKSAYFALLGGLISIFWIFLFRSYFVLPAVAGDIGWAAVIFGLGLLFLILFDYLISLLSFIVVEVSSLFVLKAFLVTFLSGGLLPLDLLPDRLVNLFRCLPFYYAAYYPATLCLGQNRGSIVQAIITIAFWDVGLLAGSVWFYRRLKNKYDGVGI
jgi:ABC-2 type transport system permease protein